MTGIIRHCLLVTSLLYSLCLGGCSAIRLGYEQSPTLLYWWLDNQLDFSHTQAPLVREALTRLQAWHRKQQLPDLAELLGHMATLAEGPVTEIQVCQIAQQLQNHSTRLANEAVRLGTPVAQTIDARQRQHLTSQWARQNAKWQEEWLQAPPEQRLQRRTDKALERYTDFYGTLTPSQVALVRRQVMQSVWTPEWGQQEMRRRQHLVSEALTAIGQGARDATDTEDRLRSIWPQIVEPPESASRERMNGWLAQSCQYIAEMHNSTRPEQRQRAARRLRAYEKDLLELASRT